MAYINQRTAPQPSAQSTPQRYPLLYWATLIYTVGIPNFVHFDSTGRTRNPINFTSISSVIIALLMGYLLLANLVLNRRPIIRREIHVFPGLWIALLAVFTLATLLQPQFHSTIPSKLDLPLSAFRLARWVLAFVLFVMLYSRTPAQRATKVVVELIGRACWISIALVWIFLPIVPQQVFGVSEESSSTVRRLGGQFIHPGHLVILAGIAFFYSLFVFPRGPRRWAGCALALITLVLTGSRIGLVGFLVSLLLSIVMLGRRPIFRWGVIAALVLSAVIGLALTNKLAKYIARGQSVQTLSSMDDRTRIWQAGMEAVEARPLIGYGYSVGARSALKDHWRYAHWLPPHAHNELIMAALCGGVVGALLMLLIYLRTLWWGILNARRGILQFFLLIAVIQTELNGVTGGLVTTDFGTLGCVFILCYIALAGETVARKQGHLKAQAARPLSSARVEVSTV